jgi:hypothetical protein
MAQTGYTPILIYSSTTVSQAPAVGNLTNSTLGSELAINITDGKLFYKDNANAIQVIAWKTTPTTAGGTGLTSYTAGDMLYYASGTTLTKLGIGTAYQALQVNAGGTAPSWQPSATSVLTAQGDLLYASAANTLARLAKSTTATRYLANTGISNNPAWSQIDLTNGVTGVLPVANGGTNASTASITAFNNITGYTASGATGTTSTNLVFSTSPSITTPTLVGDATLSTGNLIIGTSGKGIDFSATPGTGTSELLADYEEGTWTPLISSSGAGVINFTSTAAIGRYTKVGRLVTIYCRYTYTSIGSVGNDYAFMSGLPFASLNSGTEITGVMQLGQSAFDTKNYQPKMSNNGSLILFQYDNGTGALYLGAPYMLGNSFPGSGDITILLSYFTA